jgi:site-specific recombinase XerD
MKQSRFTDKQIIGFLKQADAGLPNLLIHDLRHSFASYLVNAGRSLYEVQELVGHAEINTPSRYARLSRERLVAAVEVVPQ